MSSQLYAPATLLRGNSAGNALSRRMGGFHSRSGCFRGRNNSCCCQESTHDSCFVQPVVWWLCWLRYFALDVLSAAPWKGTSRCLYSCSFLFAHSEIWNTSYLPKTLNFSSRVFCTDSKVQAGFLCCFVLNACPNAIWFCSA